MSFWSPDGRSIAFVADRKLKKVDLLGGADGASLGFFAGGKLKKVSLAGGSPVTLADAPNPGGASWGDDDTIVFVPDNAG
jgi:hypothetical protein